MTKQITPELARELAKSSGDYTSDALCSLAAQVGALTVERDGWISRELTHHTIRANLEEELVDAKEAKEDWLNRWRHEKSHGCPSWGSHLSSGTDLTCAHDFSGDTINELIQCRAERDALRAENEQVESKNLQAVRLLIKTGAERDALKAVGGQMANVMFNLSQKSGSTLTDDLCTCFKLMQKQWDAARVVKP